jgi:hypothetical protein
MTPSTSRRENHRRDPYTVVVWERNGQWAGRLRRSVRVQVDWHETRSWQQCQAAAEAMASGCVVIVPGDDATLADCVQSVQQLRRSHPATLVTVIGVTAIRGAAIGNLSPLSLEWVLREAGAADVATDAITVERIARFIERDWQRRPPSGRPLTRLIIDQLPWRSMATRR